MAKTLANYDPLVQIPSGMTPAGADFPIVESHDILVGENDKRLDAKLDDIDSAIGNVGETPIATQLSSKVNTGDIVTSVAATGSTSNNKIPSETAVRAAIEAKTINVDSTVTEGSTNAVSGGAVHTQLATKQDTLTFDTTPTASSSNPVTSGGIKTALDAKQDTLTFDTTPTASSSNPVTSGGVKAALDNKQNTLTYETTPIVGSVNPVTSTGIRNAIDAAAAGNLGDMQAQYAEFVADAEAVLGRASSLSNGMVACSNIAAETTVGDTRILLYTGTTNANYTNGHWYYNSAASNAAPSWTDGGAVGSAPTIDNTLTTAGAAADSKSVGDAIENIVTISNTQPGANSGNKVWIKETTDEEVQIPTYEEHISKANKADITTNNESDNGSGTITASKAYAIGDHFYINNTNTSSENYGVSTLYKATAAIASGSAIVVGTNCEASKVADEITSLSNDIDNVRTDLGASVTYTGVVTPQNVTFVSGKFISNTDGSSKSNTDYSYADFVNCEGYDYLRITMPFYINAHSNGLAFYTTTNASGYISGVRCNYSQNLDEDSSEVRVVQIPENAKYFRSTWYANTEDVYVCELCIDGYLNKGLDELRAETFGNVFGHNITKANILLDNIVGVTRFNNNLVNISECVDNAYISVNNGDALYNTNYFCTGFIPVVSGNTYKANAGRNLAWYNAQKVFISSVSGTTIQNGITAPENAAYLRFTVSKTSDDMENPLNLYFADVDNYKTAVSIDGHLLSAWCHGMKINWIGDSIVDGFDFDEVLCNALGLTKLTTDGVNGGIDGSTIALKADGTDERNALCLRYSNMPDDADIIAVSCGTNDFEYAWCPIGDIESTSNNTFYGALKTLCEGLITKYPQKLIFFTTPIKRAQAFVSGNGGEYTADGVMTTPFSKNKYGKTLGDYADIIKEVCGYYSIPVLDMYRESLLNPHLTSQQNLFDNALTHPNTAGKKIMARRVAGWITQLGYLIE